MEAASKSEARIAVLLDRSGSMSDYKDDVVAAINSYMDRLSADPETAGAKFSLFLFDSTGTDCIRCDRPVKECQRVLYEEFKPGRMTPLLDAIGRTVMHVGEAFAPGDQQVLAILTDGLENASRQFTNDDIASLLECKQKEGWVIVYLGANQDSWRVAAR